MNIGFIHKDEYAAKKGITPGVLEGWTKRHWTNGLEYVVIGHQTMVHYERAEQWIEGFGLQESPHQAEACGSELPRADSRSTVRPYLATQQRKVVSPQR